MPGMTFTRKNSLYEQLYPLIYADQLMKDGVERYPKDYKEFVSEKSPSNLTVTEMI